MFRKQKAENLSVEELERLLLIKRRQSRLERFQRLSGEGHSANEALVGETSPPDSETDRPGFWARWRTEDTPKPARTRSKKMMDGLLLGLEIFALVGLVTVLFISYFNLQALNDEVAVAQQNIILPTPTPPPPIALGRLPGGHSPPTAPGGAVPDVPLHLQRWVQTTAGPSNSMAPIAVDQQSNPPTRIVIPKIEVNAPIVSGVGWEDLKKGVGHLPGSANPGERGNLYLAAHNDIFGEIFRYLNKLEAGDEFFIYAGEEKFRYVVSEKRLIAPTDVEVMLPTTEPVATLQSCYPYLVDTHRLVVIGELAE